MHLEHLIPGEDSFAKWYHQGISNYPGLSKECCTIWGGTEPSGCSHYGSWGRESLPRPKPGPWMLALLSGAQWVRNHAGWWGHRDEASLALTSTVNRGDRGINKEEHSSWRHFGGTTPGPVRRKEWTILSSEGHDTSCHKRWRNVPKIDKGEGKEHECGFTDWKVVKEAERTQESKRKVSMGQVKAALNGTLRTCTSFLRSMGIHALHENTSCLRAGIWGEGEFKHFYFILKENTNKIHASVERYLTA